MRLDPSQRLQRHAANRCHHWRCDEVQRRLEVARTGREFVPPRPPVAAGGVGGVAEQGVRDEDLVTAEPGEDQQLFEAVTGAVAVERHAGARRAVTAGRLADDQQPGVERSVRRSQQVGVPDVIAAMAAADLGDQRGVARGGRGHRAG